MCRSRHQAEVADFGQAEGGEDTLTHHCPDNFKVQAT
jgi:hypothetical protein